MNINLTPRLEAMIREKVESGLYNNSSEVVREALRMMERQDREERLRTALAVGIEAVERGDVAGLTLELAEQIFQDAEAAVRAGELPDPDVAI
jgi:antitoxin ParD1/3/4